MWEIDNISQLIAFLLSLAVGCVFCLIYDIFRAVRKSFKRNAAAMFFEDVLYSLLCGVIGFCFLLGTTGGDLRAFAFIGMGAGFFICRVTLSRVILPVLLFIIRILRRVFGGISRISAAVFTAIDKAFCKCGEKMRIFFKFLANSLKKGLKKK